MGAPLAHGQARAARHARPECRPTETPARQRFVPAKDREFPRPTSPDPVRRDPRNGDRRSPSPARTDRVIIPAALPALLALRLGASRPTRLLAAWLALDVFCAVVGEAGAESGATMLERAAWSLPGLALAAVAVELHARRRTHVLPLLASTLTFVLATARGSAWWSVVGLATNASIGLGCVLRDAPRRRSLDASRAVLLVLFALDLASCLTAWIVGVHAAWPAVADLRLTAHVLLCFGLALIPSKP